MDTLACIRARVSYRGRYRQEPIPRQDLQTIMEAGLAAPSGSNKQTASLIAIDSPDLLRKIYQQTGSVIRHEAPAIICVLSKPVAAYRGRCFSTQDYAAAIENMLLAIVALGYQSCWYEGQITDENQLGQKIADILAVPPEYSVVCILPVGSAADPVSATKKKPFSELAWFNTIAK